MVQALGYVFESFDPASPGRLCRGRERWIEYETMELKDDVPPIHRLIMSGATFSDDRARDARRGLGFGPVSISTLFDALFDGGPVIAYCEEGHPHEVPNNAAGVEHHTVARPGGSLREWRVRWHIEVTDVEVLNAAIEAGADVFLRVSSSPETPAQMVHESPLIPPLADQATSLPSLFTEDLAKALFLLTGFRAPGRPNRYFQPWGIHAALEHIDAIALFHRDKHGPAVGFYSRQAPDMDRILAALKQSDGAPLLVPFAIPPMLARWDRALWDLRQLWDSEVQGEFPVPAAQPEPESEVTATEEVDLTDTSVETAPAEAEE